MRIHELLESVELPSIYKRKGKNCYFDTYRKKLIEITPEETVRQRIAAMFESRYGVPKEMILLEVPMTYYVKGEAGRADIIIHATDDGQTMYPIAVIECKNAEVLLTDKVVDQAIRYGNIVGCRYVILTNGVDLLMAAYNETSDCYQYLDGILTYEKMLCGNYSLSETQAESFERFSLEDLKDEEKLNKYNEECGCIFGKGTGNERRAVAVNLYQCLLDTEHRLPAISRKSFTLIEDIGIRFMDYSNAGGGHYAGIYRSFLVRDRFSEPQVVSISLFGTDENFRGEHRNSYTSLVVAVDHFKTSHNSLQYNIDRFSVIESNKIILFHNGQISNHPCSEVIEKVEKNGEGLKVSASGIYIGELDTDTLFYLDDKNTSTLIDNLIEYALLREEVRNEHKKHES